MRILAIVLAILLAPAAHAMEVVQSESLLGFSVLAGAREVSGTFESWSADIDFEAREIVVTVDTASATTGDALLDSVMHGAEWLNSGAFPQSTFTARDIITFPGGLHRASGTLCLGQEAIPLVVTIRETRPLPPILYVVTATFDRNVAGITGFSDVVAPTVTITGRITVKPS